jgi:hypothetical protein
MKVVNAAESKATLAVYQITPLRMAQHGTLKRVFEADESWRECIMRSFITCTLRRV